MNRVASTVALIASLALARLDLGTAQSHCICRINGQTADIEPAIRAEWITRKVQGRPSQVS